MLKSFFGGKSTACMSDYLGLQTTKRRGVSCNALYKCTTLKLQCSNSGAGADRSQTHGL